jgi:hypothetical protein
MRKKIQLFMTFVSSSTQYMHKNTMSTTFFIWENNMGSKCACVPALWTAGLVHI